MKVSILTCQGLITVFFIVIPVYAITIGVILRCNATIKSHLMRTASIKAGINAALLSNKALNNKRLCPVIKDVLCNRKEKIDLNNISSFNNVCVFSVNKDVEKSKNNACYKEEFQFLHFDHHLPRTKMNKGVFVLVDKGSGNIIFKSCTLRKSVDSLLKASNDYVEESFGSWKDVSARVCFWNYNYNSPICIVPIESLSVVLITNEEAGMPDNIGTTTVITVLVAVSVPLALFWVFTLTVGLAVRRISKYMQDISVLDFNSGRMTDSSSLLQRWWWLWWWWAAFVPHDITEILTSVHSLRLCAMAMSSYISPVLTQEILRNCRCCSCNNSSQSCERVPTQTTIRDVAIMFVSIRSHGYLTSIPSTWLWRVLNTFYRNFGQVIYSCSGAIDKYINGSIMVLFDSRRGSPTRY